MTLEQGLVLAAEMIHVQAELIELLEAALHAVGLVNLNQAGAAVHLGGRGDRASDWLHRRSRAW